ncbi:MAG: IspD/TarI family cytidylyltransferase [Candidatus Beckwithbacteria bacterium]|nr:IspD/TarI family cytidylyltransferase [Candidatus Beckwithbacteria bacterium]
MISAIITCAGNSTRFGKEKLFKLIKGEPVFIRTVKQFIQVKEIGEIVVVVRKNTRKKFEKWLKKFKLAPKIVEGGEERYVSAYKGVKVSQGDYVLIHDGARPLVSTKLINQVIQAVKKYQAVMTAVETTTSVKLINPQKMEVEQCLERQKSWLGQTPHGFKKEIILQAYEKAIRGEICGMDDCELVRKTGVKVKVVPGEWTNKKITLPSDLEIIRNWSKYV